jgi:hypothetical protein
MKNYLNIENDVIFLRRIKHKNLYLVTKTPLTAIDEENFVTISLMPRFIISLNHL